MKLSIFYTGVCFAGIIIAAADGNLNGMVLNLIGFAVCGLAALADR